MKDVAVSHPTINLESLKEESELKRLTSHEDHAGYSRAAVEIQSLGAIKTQYYQRDWGQDKNENACHSSHNVCNNPGNGQCDVSP